MESASTWLIQSANTWPPQELRWGDHVFADSIFNNRSIIGGWGYKIFHIQIYKYIYNRLHCLDKKYIKWNNSWNMLFKILFVLDFNTIKWAKKSTLEIIIELFIFTSYLFSFFITTLNHCLEVIWIYYHIIHFKPVNSWLTLLS